MPVVNTSDDAKLYYESFGAGPTILFVHGGGANHQLWYRQVLALSDQHRAVTYDLRGTGRSSADVDNFTFTRYVADLREVIDVLGVENITVVTHGFGGHILLRLLRDGCDAVASFVLCAGAPWFKGSADGVEGGFGDDVQSVVLDGPKTSRAKKYWDLSQRFLYAQAPEQWTLIDDVATGLQWSPVAIARLLQSLLDVDHRPYLSKIRIPALIAHGVKDRKNRFEGAHELVKKLGNARLVEFENSGHSPFAEESEKFNRVVDEFVRDSKRR